MIEAWMIIVFGLSIALTWIIGYYMGKTAPRNGHGEQLPESDDFVPKKLPGKKKKKRDKADEFWASIKAEKRLQDKMDDPCNEITETEAKL
jgi:hypothetical protein